MEGDYTASPLYPVFLKALFFLSFVQLGDELGQLVSRQIKISDQEMKFFIVERNLKPVSILSKVRRWIV